MAYPSLKLYKTDAVKAAKDLGYGREVIRKIDNAKTENEVSRIMAKARAERFK